jgi:host factor-I protein
MNGVQIKCFVRGFDNFIVIVEVEGRQQMIYKHAISTIIPLRPVDMSSLSKQEEEE